MNQHVTWVLLGKYLLAKSSSIDTGSEGIWLIIPGITLMLHKLNQWTSNGNRYQIKIYTTTKVDFDDIKSENTENNHVLFKNGTNVVPCPSEEIDVILQLLIEENDH